MHVMRADANVGDATLSSMHLDAVRGVAARIVVLGHPAISVSVDITLRPVQIGDAVCTRCLGTA